MNSTDDSYDLKLQSLIKRIKELQEIVSTSKPKLSQEIPVGYTPARWQLALQSFNERLPVLKAKNFFRLGNAESAENSTFDAEFQIEFGPEWDLKCAKKELAELLNKQQI